MLAGRDVIVAQLNGGRLECQESGQRGLKVAQLKVVVDDSLAEE